MCVCVCVFPLTSSFFLFLFLFSFRLASSLSSSALHSESKPDSSCASCQSSITVITQRVAILQRMVKDIQDQVSGVLRTLENTPDAKKTQTVFMDARLEIFFDFYCVFDVL